MLSNLQIINLALGVGLPAVVAFITHAKAPAQVKAVTLLGLSAVGSVLATISQSGTVDSNWRAYVGSFATTFFAAVVAHFGALKPAGVTGAEGALAGTGLAVGAPDETPTQTDNGPKPEDGAQDVDQSADPYPGSPTDGGV